MFPLQDLEKPDKTLQQYANPHFHTFPSIHTPFQCNRVRMAIGLLLILLSYPALLPQCSQGDAARGLSSFSGASDSLGFQVFLVQPSTSLSSIWKKTSLSIKIPTCLIEPLPEGKCSDGFFFSFKVVPILFYPNPQSPS